MDAPDFMDSNVLVYAYDPNEPRKRQIAQKLVHKALEGEVITSPQVLAEFSATLLHKVSPPLPPEEVITILDTLGPVKLVLPDLGTVRRAVEARNRFGIRFYDGMIVAAAERGGCRRIWSEDLNAGEEYFGVRVENPF
jgi:predicted nucleic acid-binding protein